VRGNKLSEDKILIESAKNGDMDSYNKLFSMLQPKLKSYLFRMTADINDSEDMIHDVFIKAYENISGFKMASSFKTWVFTIATNHARKIIKKHTRWHIDTNLMMRELAHDVPDLMQELEDTNLVSPHGAFEIKEHINFCLSCVLKMLRLEEQLVFLLREIYEFKLKEIGSILNFSESKVKHALQDARANMISIFDQNCAFVNKNGICNQCSELNGKFNPKQDNRKKLMEIKMASATKTESRELLLDLRTQLCRGIDPLNASGTELHAVFLKLGQMVNQKN
jgi:RNA polymerase sigma-70 factor, ECF subfamily